MKETCAGWRQLARVGPGRKGSPHHSPACLFGSRSGPFSSYYSTSSAGQPTLIPEGEAGITNTRPAARRTHLAWAPRRTWLSQKTWRRRPGGCPAVPRKPGLSTHQEPGHSPTRELNPQSPPFSYNGLRKNIGKAQ